MARRPSNLIYGVDDRPPAVTLLLLGLQHVSAMTSTLVLPVVIVASAGRPPSEAAALIQMSMVAAGIGTALQARSKGPVGSGYLCPMGIGPAWFGASSMAFRAGGAGLLFGMTALAGVMEALFSRAVTRLRPLFPPELLGVVVTMVGVELVVPGARNLLALDAPAGARGAPVALGFLTLGVMAAFTVWGKGKLRLFAMLLGLALGYAAAVLAGLLAPEARAQLAGPWFALPARAAAGWSLDPAYLLPFAIATLCSSLKGIGDLTICQKINDADWKRADMGNLSRGLLADGTANVLSGLLGGMGLSTFSSNVGLSIASGATSRVIGVAAGALFAALAFVPKLAALLVVMPRPVMGALVVYVASFMVVAGVQLIASRMLDARRTFVVGTSFVLGLSALLVPEAYAAVPGVLRPIVASSLALATLVAIALNAVFHLGLRRTLAAEVVPGPSAPEEAWRFLERCGAAWGARPEVVRRASGALTELAGAVSSLGLAKGPLRVEGVFDELNLDVAVTYPGAPLLLSTQRPEAEALEDDAGMAALAGYLVARQADGARSEERDGRCRIDLHFVH